jgi:1A family penicillin-binding protein
MQTEQSRLPQKTSVVRSINLTARFFLALPLLIFNLLSLIGLAVVIVFEVLFKIINIFLNLILQGVKTSLTGNKRSRGRPRSRPLSLYLQYKFTPLKLWLNKFFPKPVRFGLGLILTLVVIFYYSSVLIRIAHELPSPTKLSDVNDELTTTFYDRNGQVLYRLFDDKNRYLVKLEETPTYLQQATISIEDKNFYSHQGFDLEGITRAALSYFEHKEVLQGGSTITQQLIKNTLLSPEQTFQRKIKEVVLAFWAERIFSKHDILQMYLNEVPYGGTSFGIAAASQTYFGKSPKELSLAEAAYLAGLPASPTAYSPYGANPQLGKMRQKEVLSRMTEDGYITKKQAQDAYNEQLNIKPELAEIKAPHFVMYVKQLLTEKYGEKMVSQGGLKVYTSLDLNLQNMAQGVVADQVKQLSNLNVSNGAAEIVDAKTGQILAMVGSKDYWQDGYGSFNVATALRQPGSSIKPITYATGFKIGYSPGSVMLDAPIAFTNAWETYAPVNYDGRFHGPVTIRTALGSSYNIPAVKMLNMVGIPSMLQTAHDMGITTLNDTDRYGLSLTLGGGEVKLVDMMTVYDTFSQMGVRHDPVAVLKVTDPSGQVLEDNTEDNGKRVLPASIAFLITDILKDNNARTPAFGPKSLLIINGHTVAVKTGTTDSKKDNWAFGYTPDYVVGAWVGNNNGDPMNPALSSGVTGASPIWHDIFTKLLDGKADLAFQRPPDVVDGMVDGHKDLVISGQTKTIIGLNSQKHEEEKKTPKPQDLTFTDPISNYSTIPSN